MFKIICKRVRTIRIFILNSNMIINMRFMFLSANKSEINL